MKPQADLPEKIAERTAQLSAVRKQKDVLARQQLDSLVVPSVPQEALAVLAKSVTQISEATEAKVKSHLQHLDQRGESWIRQGLGYVRRDDRCPFCAQDLGGVDLVSLYRDFFSNTYREHLVEIERASNSLEQTLGDDALQALQKRLAANDARIQGWNDLADLQEAAYEPAPLEAAWRHLRQVLRERLRRKTANPSESVVEDAPLTAAVRDYQSVADSIRKHNEVIAAANKKIAELKQQAAATKPEALEEQLRMLRNTQIRHESSTQQIVEDLQAARERKKVLEAAKATKKEELGKVSTAVLAKYQTAINRLLKNFGANFSIVNTRPVFPGGKASSTYQLELNGTVLDIGDANTPRGKPCFRTALSTGDKSTLALAFFLARLEQDDISMKCIVIDDPLSSFDSFRTACTQQEVAGVVARAMQTVVLSHDALFLKGVFDRVDRSTTKCLQVVREGDTHVLREWPIADYFLKEAHGDYFLLKSYVEDGPPENGDLKAVASAIRTFIEGHLRHVFPGEFPETEWLGGFIEKARGATSGPLAGLSVRLPELEAINDYSKAFHHSSSTPAKNPTDAELRPWVGRALKFVQGG